MNTAYFTVIDGYDRNKIKRTIQVRPMTLDEIKGLYGHADFLANDGTLRTIKINGRVKTWKTRPDEVSVPVKYGLREYGRFDTAEALRRFVVRMADECYRERCSHHAA